MRMRRAAQQRLMLEFATEGAVSQEEFKEQMTRFFAQMDQQDRCARSFQSVGVALCSYQTNIHHRGGGVGLLPTAAAR
jgi:aminoglycoside phosphotransferase family enzyme